MEPQADADDSGRDGGAVRCGAGAQRCFLFEFGPGINWIYLPAGVRLICILLFGEAGALGVLLGSWLAGTAYFFPEDIERVFIGGLRATGAPYAVYRIARHVFGLKASLVNLTSGRLFACMVAYGIASPLLHHVWFYLRGDQENFLKGFVAMAAGDLCGILIVVYTLKIFLAWEAHRRGTL